MRTIISCLLLLNFFLVQSAWSAEWVEVAIGVNGSLYYVDRTSVKLENEKILRYWMKTVHKNEKNIPGETFRLKGKKVWYSKSFTAEDCKNNRSYQSSTATYYGLSHEVLYTSNNLYPKAQMLVPESIGEIIHSQLCTAFVNNEPVIQENLNEKIKIDLNRWQEVFSSNSILGLYDPLSVKSCGAVYGKICSKHTYGEIAGFEFWLVLGDQSGNQLISPVKSYIDCTNRKLNGKDVAPESDSEKIYSFFCSRL